MLVMKFGGSSVADQSQIHKVLQIVASRRDRRPLVVCSAHKGITDALVATAKAAAERVYDPEAVITRQREIADGLGCPPDLLTGMFDEIRDLVRGISLVKELSPRSLDYISSFGERMSVRCIADYFRRHGLAAEAHDVWDLGFITDSNFGAARPTPGFDQRVQQCMADRVDPAVVPVITGFVGKNERGEITTVGRNGSDLTASLLAAALRATEVQIWTDTDGVMTADPSVVEQAKNIPAMAFDEAAELAYFGSRVLHPSTLLPAMASNIPVRVLNTNRPNHPGTVIQQQPKAYGDSATPTSVAYKENQTIVTLSTTRMFAQAGFLAPVFDVLGRHHVVVDVISTSEVSVSLSTNTRQALVAALPELEQLGDVQVHHHKTILAVVGQSLARQPGVAARVLQAVASAGVNVEMISHATSSPNLTMVIDDRDIRAAVVRLHDELFCS
ncbi:MAG: aspartate kinase [Myxococcales bacterium FL481]|nr:MAG: aspartate kinase [Myxococcales bacterium FL481]